MRGYIINEKLSSGGTKNKGNNSCRTKEIIKTFLERKTQKGKNE